MQITWWSLTEIRTFGVLIRRKRTAEQTSALFGLGYLQSIPTLSCYFPSQRTSSRKAKSRKHEKLLLIHNQIAYIGLPRSALTDKFFCWLTWSIVIHRLSHAAFAITILIGLFGAMSQQICWSLIGLLDEPYQNPLLLHLGTLIKIQRSCWKVIISTIH